MKVQLVKTGKIVDCHHSVAKGLFDKGVATHVNPEAKGSRSGGRQLKKKLSGDERQELEELRALLAGQDVEEIEDEESEDEDTETETEVPAAKTKAPAKKTAAK